MNFLDPKERVLDLELTSYGRYLLSVGKFSPSHYAFFDDDIIYDATYAGITTEHQSETEERIQEETPRLGAQTVFSAREVAVFSSSPNVINDLIIGQDIENLREVDKQKLEQRVRVQEQPDNAEVLQQPIGNSNPAYDKNPAWLATFLKAPLSSSAPYQTISSSLGILYKNIPQLNVNIEYQIYRNSAKYNFALDPKSRDEVFDIEPREDVYNLLPDAPGNNEILANIKFETNSSIVIQKDRLVLRLEEANTFYQKENFEIELYEIEEVGNVENLLPLKFYDNQNKLFDDKINGTIEKQTAEQYFSFLVDGEILPENICPLIREDKTPQFFQRRMYDCEDLHEEFTFENIYQQNNDTEDFCP
ncbi:MAG: hypothetical protein GOVbin630_80 [Prokaryotic dsDNA virus sp.]|nr:MAG: hypothetical protein GOVbin630_80 [Prokaryotic dsDNA virus sp.]|tara:strand:+ start:23228 stop:24313 length:1086 start_codon:yes stop_codon:yes gene_type:complete